ncbi:PTS transporter subunit EIIC [Actinomyces trachealis]|uniref:PTS transporter subunit EIIC n=1 Tax=Actinomyces trachealis TaxID=2763540 RepID=UPI001FCFEBE3|nr:PTS transporter subunit EIIC [Actinomyces trachealis]
MSGNAALAGIVGYLVMVATIKGLIEVFYPGSEDMSIDTGVVGSLVVGGMAVWLHNRYHSIRLPQVLGFFGGSRFVPIVTSFAAILVGAVFFLVWPTFQGWLTQAGNSIASLGVVGTFLYGLVMRLSGAVGLHHIIYPMFWYTELGGTEVVAGESVVGAQKIFFAGRFDTMIFGLPGAALAMYHAVPKARRKAYLGLFLGVALTSILTSPSRWSTCSCSWPPNST